MGKVPAIRHGGVLVTEQVAIFLYLADLFPEADLAPKIGDPMRGPYLRLMIFYAACYEPALVDKGMKRDPAPLAMSPYGDFDTMFATINEQLAKGTYLLGDTLSAADILWGMALSWGLAFKLIPESPTIANYVARTTARPRFVEVSAMDAKLAVEHEAALAHTQE